ncbi:hypothetical protein EDB87DRAFT_1638005 [Lactarius vividus]|nr:hypothetical protein EDB87DRAFT_1638005 [Lactarius vividus]
MSRQTSDQPQNAMRKYNTSRFIALSSSLSYSSEDIRLGMTAGSTILVIITATVAGRWTKREGISEERIFEAFYPTAPGILSLLLLAHIVFSFRSANADSRNLVDSTTPVGGLVQ